jgi:hypothetical protein
MTLICLLVYFTVHDRCSDHKSARPDCPVRQPLFLTVCSSDCLLFKASRCSDRHIVLASACSRAAVPDRLLVLTPVR